MKKTITLYEFNSLELNDQMEVINQQGCFIDNHITKKEKCNLYAVRMFFVEVVYDSKHNTITELRSFKSGFLIDKYSNLTEL
nr:hypothetical protein [uncultured Psychroserpens sp.]